MPRPHPLPRGEGSVLFSSNFWGLVQNSGEPIRIVPRDLDKWIWLKMAAISATSWILQQLLLQRHSKVGSRARVGSAYVVGGWRTVSLVMFNASSAAFACKGSLARKPLQWCKQDVLEYQEMILNSWHDPTKNLSKELFMVLRVCHTLISKIWTFTVNSLEALSFTVLYPCFNPTCWKQEFPH